MATARKLTEKQKKWCKEYLKDLNATQAAIRAGYSKKSAKQQGTENLAKPSLMAVVNKEIEKRNKQCEIDADYVLKRLVNELEADLGDLYNDKGGIKGIHDWPLIWRQGLVGGMEIKQDFVYEDGQRVPDGVTVKMKLSERVKRLELLGRHVKVQAFKDKVEVEVDGTLVEKLNAAAVRSLAGVPA